MLYHRSGHRFNLVLVMLLVYLSYALITRLGLGLWAYQQADLSLLAGIEIFWVGLLYDLAFYSYIALLPSLYLWLVPDRIWSTVWHRYWIKALILISLYIFGFVMAAEFLFWQEFSSRFNFVAIDYWVYHQEILNNIRESYPLLPLFSGILLLTALVYRSIQRPIQSALNAKRQFSPQIFIWLSLPLFSYLFIDQDLYRLFNNNYQQKLAANGPYQFFSVLQQEDIIYPEVYARLDDEQASQLLKSLLKQPTGQWIKEGAYQIKQRVQFRSEPQRLNIMLIMMESLSFAYMEQGLTPNLSRLAEQSLFFSRFYATGTRTTRGLESVTLSIPPTPGRSIVKRVGQETGLDSLGQVLRHHGYDVRFIYGGRSQFDNMQAFFSGNGYQVLDQAQLDQPDFFHNAWGMADEHLFDQVLKLADEAQTPFFFHVLTVSNHRPYTYPEGRIKIKHGPEGAVQYSDWALARFIEKAKQKPWFQNTLFVILADHCAHSAGKVDLPIEHYHIPLLIYAPDHIQAQRIERIASQVDIAPTLLALLKLDYQAAFFGQNILSKTALERAFIANYQKLGLYEPQHLSILAPKQQMIIQSNPETEPSIDDLDQINAHLKKTIAYYQGAYHVYHRGIHAWSDPQ